MAEKSWAEKHPIITGALVGSVVPGIGTLAGALGGVIYDITERALRTPDISAQRSANGASTGADQEMIHAFIKFCLVYNAFICQLLEIAPVDHVAVSQPECMRAMMMGDQREFDYQGARWRIAGGYCREVPLTDVQRRLRAAFTAVPTDR